MELLLLLLNHNSEYKEDRLDDKINYLPRNEIKINYQINLYKPLKKSKLPMRLRALALAAAPQSHSASDFQFDFAEGPQQKSKETQLFEDLVCAILSDDVCSFSVDENGERIVIFNRKFPVTINLSALLPRVNLSHLDFDSVDIQCFEEHIKSKYASELVSINCSLKRDVPEVFKKMPEGLLYAIALYTFIERTNDFANGDMKLGFSERQIKLIILCLAFFAFALRQMILIHADLVSSIVIELIEKKIIKNIDELDGKKIHASLEQKLITKKQFEILAEYLGAMLLNCARKDDMEWLYYKDGPVLAKKTAFTSTTFFSDYEGELTNVSFGRNNRFIFPVTALSFFPEDGEIPLPAGTQVLFQKANGGDRYHAQVVNTPDTYTLPYQSVMALRYVYHKYLKQAYRDEPQQCVVIDNKVIQRPVHNGASTTCTLFYLPEVIRYFSQYAADRGLREYCRVMESDTSFILQLMLIFMVTGRQGEVSYKDDPQKYIDYRKASAENFKTYALSIGMSLEWVEQLTRIVRYMGDPNFMMTNNNPEENYLYHIVTYAHKLNLKRVIDANRYAHEIGFYISPNFVVRSPEQENAMFALENYSVECLKITGNSVVSIYSKHRGFRDVDLQYAQQFKDASLDPAFCEKVLQQVPTPSFREKAITSFQTFKEFMYNFANFATKTQDTSPVSAEIKLVP